MAARFQAGPCITGSTIVASVEHDWPDRRGQIFELGPHINAALASRLPRFAAGLFDLAFIILILPSSSMAYVLAV
jgi:hypothetical protein